LVAVCHTVWVYVKGLKNWGRWYGTPSVGTIGGVTDTLETCPSPTPISMRTRSDMMGCLTDWSVLSN